MDDRPELAELVDNVRTNKWHELGLQLNLEDNDLVAIGISVIILSVSVEEKCSVIG